MVREFTEKMKGTLLELQSDYSEKYKPEPDGLFQSQYFGRTQSISMEGYATRYWNSQKEKFGLNYYSALFDEQRQDGGTTSWNMSKLLADIFIDKKELIWDS